LGEGLLQIGGEWYDPEGIEGPLPPADYTQPQQQPIDPAVLELQDLKAQGRMMPGLLRANPYAIGAELAGLISPGGPTYDHTLDENWRVLQEKSPANKDRYMTWDFKENRPGREYSKANRFTLDPTSQGRVEELRNLEHIRGAPEGWIEEQKSLLDSAQSEPAVLYHGTPNFEGDSINLDRLGARDKGKYGSGFYMSANPEYARIYAGKFRGGYTKDSGQMIPLYSNIQDPFSFSHPNEDTWGRVTGVLDAYGVKYNDHKKLFSPAFDEDPKKQRTFAKQNGIEMRRQLMQTWADQVPMVDGDITKLLKLAGYDSSMVIGPTSPSKGFPRRTEVIIFNPNQAKSIFNQGTWNPLTEDLHTNLGSYLNASSTT